MDRMRCAVIKGRAARLLGVTLLGWMALSSSGCLAIIPFIAYMIKGRNVPAEFDGLASKKVAVVCRPPHTMTQDQAVGCRELGARLTYLLQTNVKKIDMVSQQDVANWTDENNLEDFVELGKALGADIVVAVEMDTFSLYGSGSIYKGRADYHIAVYDVKDGGKVLFEKHPGETSYPPTGGEAITKPKANFRRKFVDNLAEEIGRHFYPHDRAAGYAVSAEGLDAS
ncbi:MAG: hypothetical protein HYS13_14225 [Planctomycetia bacterium]|nr:hypothetical protein [Planctomycetia bacterium]